MQDSTTASAVFRQLRALPSDAAAHAAQLALVRQLVLGELELHLPRKARARALLEWAANRCAVKEAPNAPSATLDPDYWALFAQILSLKDDSRASSSNSASLLHEASNLLSKSDIRQTALLSRGISLLNALKTIFETVPALLVEKPSQELNSVQSLLTHVHKVFVKLFPLSLSSPNTTLDGLLPCIHAFIRSSAQVASSTGDILPAWTRLGQLLLSTLSSLVKPSSNVQSATSNDKLLLRKVAASFLDQSTGYANWKAYLRTSTSILKALSRLDTDFELGKSASKGKNKAVEVIPTESPSSISNLTHLQALLDVNDGFITASMLSSSNIARYFSSSSGTTLDTPRQAQEALSELFNALKASLHDSTSNSSVTISVSEATVTILPRLVKQYIDTLSSHTNELFAPVRRNRGPVDISGDAPGASASAASSRSAIEYQVQTQYRTAVFGMLHGVASLLKDAYSFSRQSNSGNSPQKRKRVEAVSTNAGMPGSTVAEALKFVLAEIQERNIYIAGGGEANRSWLSILKTCTNFIVSDLLGPDAQASASASTASMQAIALIARMDYTALEESLPSTLKAMARIVSEPHTTLFSEACEKVFGSALSYNGKTRQLPSFVNRTEEAIISFIDDTAASAENASDLNDRLNELFNSPLLSRRIIVLIVKECRASSGANQFVPLAKGLVSKLHDHLLKQTSQGSGSEAGGQPPKKKAKQGRASNVIIPLGSVPEETCSWKIYGLSQILQAILASNTSTIVVSAQPAEAAELMTALESAISGELAQLADLAQCNLAQQRSMSAILQLVRAAELYKEGKVFEDDQCKHMSQALAQPGTLVPTLQFELIRSLLAQISVVHPAFAEPLLDQVLAILEAAPVDQEAAWDGGLHDLTTACLPPAIWWLVATQYIDVVEQTATQEQLNKLISFLFSHSEAPSQGKDITIPAVTSRLLHSANFFELLRVRETISNYIGSHLDDQKLAGPATDVLLLLPKEYLDRSLKRRISNSLASRTDVLSDDKALLGILKYTNDDAGTSLIKDTAFLQKLASQGTTQTSKLVTRLFEQLWRLMLQNWTASPERFAGLPEFFDAIAQKSGDQSELTLLCWSVLSSEVKAAGIPEPTMIQLQLRLPAVTSADFGTIGSVTELYVQLKARHTAQIVSKWMAATVSDLSPRCISYGEENGRFAKEAIGALLRNTFSTAAEKEDTSVVLAALELYAVNLPPSGLEFEQFVAMFWLLCQKHNLQDARFTALLAKTCLSQTEEAYAVTISTMSEAISPEVQDKALEASMHVLVILLCNPPEGAARIASQAFSATLRRMILLNSGESIGTMSSQALKGITSYIKAFLEQRIGVPELHDVAAIWSILHDILSSSMISQVSVPTIESDATSIFLNSIDIVSVLATHRRDHIIPTFASFCRVISDILDLLRLSGTSSSSSMIACRAAFPAWALAGAGRWMQDPKCGKSVARLLLSLGTRTTVLQRSSARNKGSSSSSVVSLAGPLGKHAPFILINYLKAATDSRFAISSALRKEINPGILEVISTMGKSEREALMKGYLHNDQEAERTLLRVMWKEFDAVRYKGD